MLLCFVVFHLGPAGSARGVRLYNDHAIEVASHANRRAVFPKFMSNVSSGPYFSLLLYVSLKLVCLDTLNGTVTL